MTIATALAIGTETLVSTSSSARLDAEVLLKAVLGVEGEYLITHASHSLNEQQERLFRLFLERRGRSIPIAAIIEKKEWYGLEFIVTVKTLIPRPETELLVDCARDFFSQHPSARSLVDVGTGSGCVAVALATHLPQLRYILATDISSMALEVAKRNVLKHNLSYRITCKRYNGVRLIKESFDCLVANPPYLTPHELAEAKKTSPELHREPQIALLGGPDGLTHYRQIIQRLHRLIRPQGAAFLEIHPTRTEGVLNLIKEQQKNASFTIFKDLAGHDRVIRIDCSRQ